jgi:DNA mismatch repair ATPase MutS
LEDLENKNQVVNSVKYVVREVIKKSEIEKEIQELDPLNLTPLEALNYLYNLKKKLGE